MPRSQKMSRSRPINVSVSSQNLNQTSRSREKWEGFGLVLDWKPNVSVSDINVHDIWCKEVNGNGTISTAGNNWYVCSEQNRTVSNINRHLWEKLINPRRHERRLVTTTSNVHQVRFNVPPFLNIARTDVKLQCTYIHPHVHAYLHAKALQSLYSNIEVSQARKW